MTDLVSLILRLFISGFFALFPSAFCTVGLVFVTLPFIAIPLNAIRQKALLREGVVYTNPQIEQRIAKEHKVIHFLSTNFIWIIFGLLPFLWLFWTFLFLIININPFNIIYYI